MDTVSNILDEKGRNVFTVHPDATVAEAVEKMCAHKVGALVVCEGELPIATFTERDLMSRVVLNAWDPQRTIVRDVMTTVAASIPPDTEVTDAMKLMTRHRCRHLPVVSAGRMVGVVSMGDLVSWASRSQAFEMSMLRDLVTYGH